MVNKEMNMKSREKLIALMDRLVELKAKEIHLYAAAVKFDRNDDGFTSAWVVREANCVKIDLLEEKLKTAIAAQAKREAKAK